MSKEERFQKVMHAIDDHILEEVQMGMEKEKANQKAMLRTVLALVACLCLVTAIVLGMQHRGNAKDDAAEPVVTEEELLAYGYDMHILQDARGITYSLITMDDTHEAPMAQAEFMVDGKEYVYRALKTDGPEDISGVTDEWKEQLNWSAGNLNLQMNKTQDDVNYVSWYTPENRIQWCLSTKEDSLSLMTTAQQIMFYLGYDVAVAPEGATDITYHAFAMEDMTVAETTFFKEGVHYTYRVAGSVWITDISGISDTFEVKENGMIGWCDAELSYTAGGAGKILWYDFAPGLMYSLSMDSGATPEQLLQMAEELYEPAQQEVG